MPRMVPTPPRSVPRMPNLRALVACLLLTPLAACASQGFEVAAHTQTVSYREHMDPSLIEAAGRP